MGRKIQGNMDDAGLDPAAPTVVKSADELTAQNLERMCKAIETLEQRAPTLSKAQLFQVQYEAGRVHKRLQMAIFNYITRLRGGKVNRLEKVNDDSMKDCGLDDDQKPVIPNVGTPEKFVKSKKVDAFGETVED